MTHEQAQAWKQYKEARATLRALAERLESLSIDPDAETCECCGGPCGDGTVIYEDGVAVCGECEACDAE